MSVHTLSGDSLVLHKVEHKNCMIYVSIKKILIWYQPIFVFYFILFLGDKDEKLILSKYLTITLVSDGKLQK